MSANHVLILRSSPRRKANSSVLADQLAAGARDAGAAVESFDLHTMDIRPCDACEFCQGSGNGQCAIDDDMQVLYPKIRQADSIVIATPIYWFTISAQAKLCIDRWYALQGDAGNVLAGKKVGVLLSYGDSDPYVSGAANAIHTFQDIFRYVGADLVGMVYGTASRAGEIESQPDLLERAYQLGRRLGNGS